MMLSKDLITHKLLIEGEKPQYITLKEANSIFDQLNNPNTQKITIQNSQELSYRSFFKDKIELKRLKDNDMTLEDIIYANNLNTNQATQLREMMQARKREKKKINDQVILNMIEYIREI